MRVGRWVLLWRLGEAVQPTAETVVAWSVVVVGLLGIGGVAFGLSVGLMHVDILALEVKGKSSLQRQALRIRKVLDLVGKYHKTYVVLRLLYSISLPAVPAILYHLYPLPLTCVVAWVLLILFSHCVPLLWFSGPREIARISVFSPLLQLLTTLLSPLILPISYFLDRFSHSPAPPGYTLPHLKRSLFLHSEAVTVSRTDILTLPQLTMLHGMLDVAAVPVLLHMLPMDRVFSVSKDALLCEELIEEIVRQGYSRIPVTDAGKVLGVLHVSALLQADRSRTLTLSQSELPFQPCIFFPKDSPLSSVLLHILEANQQLAAIVDICLTDSSDQVDLSTLSAIGIITLTDLMNLALKVRKTQESPTPPSSNDQVSQDSFVHGGARKGAYRAFDYEETHSQDIRGTTDVDRSGY